MFFQLLQQPAGGGGLGGRHGGEGKRGLRGTGGFVEGEAEEEGGCEAGRESRRNVLLGGLRRAVSGFGGGGCGGELRRITRLTIAT